MAPIFGYFFAVGAGVAAGVAVVVLLALEVYRRRFRRGVL